MCIDAAVSNIREEDGEPIKEYTTEINAYFEEQKQKNSTERNKRQTGSSKNCVILIIGSI